ncbi:hypothetical protein [Maledivibacter halophilus]|uniref:hypothetical protein n=1 Tax=Maledivibacter halophilus TaxID=36842 RepID=UPI0009A6C3AA|nr:hypothetical protein [Maledivibacter halophilus]
MIKSHNAIIKLIDRYDYGGALEILQEMDLKNTDEAIMIKSCKYAVNFDFNTSYYILNSLSEEKRNHKIVLKLIENLKALIEGEPQALFSELINNIKFQIVNEEYIDFLGRIYRFKEAILKYIFVKEHLNRNKFSFLIDAMSKRRILKILRKKYKIYNPNLIYGISIYINKYVDYKTNYVEIVKLLNSEKMRSLMELRHNSIVGHGFRGVSREDIVKVYGNPYNIIDDFKYCLNLLNINVMDNKYNIINDFLKRELNCINYDNNKSKYVNEMA